MRKIISFIAAVFCIYGLKAQELLTPINTSSYGTHSLPVFIPKDTSQSRLISLQNIVPPPPTPISYWEKKNELGIVMSQVAFSNWNAGGNNAISGISSGNFVRKYKRGNVSWNNELLFRYGLNAQEDQKLRKSDDAVQLNSTFGYRTHPKSDWYYSAKFTFQTQFTNGYKYPDRDNPISKFMAPGYLFFGLGTEYSPTTEKFTAYFSPATMKATYVLDQDLANQGAFGVDKALYDAEGNLIKEGKQTRTEVGILVTSLWEKDVYKNMSFTNRVSLYTDYLNDFGNVDVDWELNFNLVVNEYVKANVGAHIKYDNDVKTREVQISENETIGLEPKLQLKQILGVGVSYVF
ncbi:DUF3078 domain-containing protein [Sinomicrobium weinanense]|uniref:DUF3078 domain-containing protein n=1 Tax=Sinomicrobium weinanense TaxID=2842200 RepID=A0A926JPA0_9FLAO|nr:DUF3078 domain-containing protein [Sinomicrobium weinanense]MBC9794896.1 DUF3078 domain-containing protein [Sinomicrobium weinanense]MBU3125667.1 DUF3078 domain-containing protein [Sinomicrobium weinanense]